MSDTTSERLEEYRRYEIGETPFTPIGLTSLLEDAIAEIRRLEEATIGKIEEHHELWLEHEALKDKATRYQKALERIAKILEDDDLQSASKVARAHRVIRHWRKNAALEADHE